MTRKNARHEFAELLTVELGDLVNTVYTGQVADFSKARAVAAVSSAGTSVQIVTRNFNSGYVLYCDLFVMYADPDAGWTEEMAEDRLDDISAKVQQTVQNHQTGNYWFAADWTEPSNTDPVNIGGVEYRWERIKITLSS